jgi:prepilin-type N-terminal cleavage/methylation domain-containing protein
MRRHKRGFTLIEVIIATVITCILMGLLSTTYYCFMTMPAHQSDQLTATNQLRLALDFIQYDGVQAKSFTPGSDPYEYYGYFSSYTDPQGSGNRTVAYKYDDGRLLREESIDGDLDSRIIAFHIADAEDAVFEYDGDKQVTVSIMATVNPDTMRETTKMDTRQIDMRAANSGGGDE